MEYVELSLGPRRPPPPPPHTTTPMTLTGVGLVTRLGNSLSHARTSSLSFFRRHSFPVASSKHVSGEKLRALRGGAGGTGGCDGDNAMRECGKDGTNDSSAQSVVDNHGGCSDAFGDEVSGEQSQEPVQAPLLVALDGNPKPLSGVSPVEHADDLATSLTVERDILEPETTTANEPRQQQLGPTVETSVSTEVRQAQGDVQGTSAMSTSASGSGGGSGDGVSERSGVAAADGQRVFSGVAGMRNRLSLNKWLSFRKRPVRK